MRPFTTTSGAARRFLHGSQLTMAAGSAAVADRDADAAAVDGRENAPAVSCRLFPTLRAIDQARGDLAEAFASAPHAAQLERFARAYMEHHWSEVVWLTGCVDQGHWNALCAALEHECVLLAAKDGEVSLSA